MKTMQRRRETKTASDGFTSAAKPRPARIAPGNPASGDPAIPSTAPVTLVGKLIGFSERNTPLVDYVGRIESAALGGAEVRTTVPLGKSQVGSEVVLVFAGRGANEPIIVGCIVPPVVPTPTTGEAPSLDVELNGKRLELTAEDEIVLRCGNASITLTKAGKVLIRGAYLLSRSSGVNRIKGGSVQIN